MPQTSPMNWSIISISPMLVLVSIMNKSKKSNKMNKKNFNNKMFKWSW